MRAHAGSAKGALLALVIIASSGCTRGSGAPAAADVAAAFVPTHGLRLIEVARGLDHPLYVTAPAGDSRVFIVEQTGRVKILEGGRLRERPYLDLHAKLTSGGERGLLSIAFHPGYAANGFVFVNYTDQHGDTRVERYRVSADRNVVDPGSARLVLTVAQPYVNHNGGHLLFGPDGMLWIGMGDGGAGGDPHGNGQNPGALLGKLLRIAPDISGDPHAPPYRIPADNPYSSGHASIPAGARPEIWALGLRNPWRFAFDDSAKLLYIADVGQDKWEEIDVSPLRTPGLDYGWNLREGRHDYKPRAGSTPPLAEPLVEYGHAEGCSVTGGFVYRGSAMPELSGTYFFSDYCQGWIRSFRVESGRAIERREWTGLEAGQVTSFGLDAAGELYLTSASGRVLRFVRAAAGGG